MNIHCDILKPKSKFNPRNMDAAIELYLSSLEEKLMKVEVSKDKFNNLTKSEQKALYDLKYDKSIVIKSADKGSAVQRRLYKRGRKDYMKEAEKQLSDEQVYEEVSNDTAPLLKTISKNKKMG